MGNFWGKLNYIENGEMFSGRTYGIGDVGILTPSIEYSGMVGLVKCGETVAAGDLLYPNSTAQEFMKADPTQAAIKGPAICMALEAGSNGNYSLALFSGYIKNSAWLTTEYLCSKARGTMTSGVTVDEELFVIGSLTFACDISDDGVTGADQLIVPASTSQAHWEAAFTKAIYNALATVLALDASARAIVENDWAANELDFIAVQAGIAGNSIATTEACTNISWGATALAGGTDTGVVYCGDSGKCACLANIPATTNDMVQVVGNAISPTELILAPITDYDLSA